MVQRTQLHHGVVLVARPAVSNPSKAYWFWAASILIVSIGFISSVACQGSLTPKKITSATQGANVVVIVLDAAAAGHFGSYGYARNTTPHLDSLATESVLFEQAYAQASGTMLSVYSYFTSLYPIFEYPVHPKALLTLPDSLTTVAEVLRRQLPHSLGFTANTWTNGELGHAQGFDDYLQLWDLEYTPERGSPKVEHMAPLALEWMRDHRDGFFVYLHFMKPHSPYNPPAQYYKRFVPRIDRPLVGTNAFLKRIQGQRPPDHVVRDIIALYDGNLAYIDDHVGRLIRDMKADGLWENTIFVVTADHGEGFWQHNGYSGHGGMIYEEAVRVPLLIRVPGVARLAGTRVSTPVELVDLLPTLADLERIPIDDLSIVGRSLVPLMAGSTDSGVIHTRTNRRDPPHYAVRVGPYKLHRFEEDGRRELYDLVADPGEQIDLIAAGTPPANLDELESILADWIEWDGAGGALGSTDSLDAESISRLRALGYID